MSANIRNFCIIAHIDHGKSTLADRFLELTCTVDKRHMKEQLLDQMELERERGITIKLQPVRMMWQSDFSNQISIIDNSLKSEVPACRRLERQRLAGRRQPKSGEFTLNLIDTPGHVDFTYEVSRSLAAVEGAILLVDVSQGVQAQTIANLYLALEQNLTIIPVLNKIDLPNADIDKACAELIHLLDCKEENILKCSGKTGEGVAELLEAVIERIPPPVATTHQPTRALIFDSVYDDYRGVVASVRVKDGQLKKGDSIKLMQTGAIAEIIELGHYTPQLAADSALENGQIGYVATGLKNLGQVRVGDTITLSRQPSAIPLHGYKKIKSMVFAGVFPKDGDQYQELRDAMAQLKLNDSALTFEPESSPALGFGFRAGFLGMLHLEIFQERLKREHGVEVVSTVPSVAYQVTKTDGKMLIVKSPQELPNPSHLQTIEEPWMRVDIITPGDFIGNVMSLVAERNGRYINTEYLSTGKDKRALLHYELPLASLITDFYDKLKTVTSGYASLNYELKAYEPTDVIRLDILIAEKAVEALATLVWRDEAYRAGKKIVESLKETLPKQQFVLKIQAAIGGKVIAAEHLSAIRKDVLAKMSGGDVTRKRKLLERQKKGKKKMMGMGRGTVEIPTEAYLAVLKR